MNGRTAAVQVAGHLRPGSSNGFAQNKWLCAAYLAACLAICLPYLTPLGSGGKLSVGIKWIPFLAVVASAVVLWGRGLGGAFSWSFGALLVANAGLRLLSVAWSGLPTYTFYRAVSFCALTLFLLVPVRQGLRSTQDFRRMAWLIMAVGAILIFPGLLCALVGVGRVPWTGSFVYRGGRFAGILGNPNTLGIVASVVVPLCWGLWLSDKRKWSALLVAAAGIASLLASQSRAGMVGVMAGVGTVACVRMGKARLGIVLAAMLVGGLMLVAFFAEPTRAVASHYMRVSPGDVSVGAMVTDAAADRVGRWQMAMASIERRPILGQGYGIDGTGYELRGDYDFGYAPHSSFVSLLQENGYLGLLLAAPIILGIVLGVLSGRGQNQPSEWRSVGAVFAGAAIGGLSDAVFESWLFSVGNVLAVPFWTCVMAFWMISFDRRDSRRRGVVASIDAPAMRRRGSALPAHSRGPAQVS